MVEFCSSCGAIILGKKGEEIKCSSCDTVTTSKSSVKLSEKVEKKETLEVIDKNDNSSEIHPVTPVECPKCHHGEAFYWTRQTRAGDEPETQFFKCTKCSHKWRDYR